MTLATLTRRASGFLILHFAAAGKWTIDTLSDLRGMWRAETRWGSDIETDFLHSKAGRGYSGFRKCVLMACFLYLRSTRG
jgi:hypothetical protein